MQQRMGWIAIIVLAVCVIGYAAYASRKPGPCAFNHIGSCTIGFLFRGY